MLGREELHRRLKLVLGAYIVWAGSYELVGFIARQLPTHDLTLAIDRAIPLMPSWVWVYELAYFLPFIGMFIIERPKAFDHTLRAILVAAACAYVPYLLYPVSFARPELGTSLAERVLAFEYGYDAGSNQLPSLHVANALLVYLGARKQWLGRGGDAAVLTLATLITLSTLFVKQHLVLDALGGIALAFFAYFATGPRTQTVECEQTE